MKKNKHNNQNAQSKTSLTSQEQITNALNKKLILSLILVIIFAGILVYFNSLTGKFLYDDNALVVDNSIIKNSSDFSKIFTRDIYAGCGDSSNFYRPMQILMYRINYMLGGLNPVGFHITSALAHILAALCVFWLIAMVFNNITVGFLSGLIFVMHPVHTEAVSYIAGIADPLAGLFTLLSIAFYIKYLNPEAENKIFGGMINFIASILFYILAILSKESSLILPFALLLYHLVFKIKIKNKLSIALVFVTFFYILTRVFLFKSAFEEASTAAPLLLRIPGVFTAISRYFLMLIFPVNLHMEYGNPVFPYTTPWMYAGIILLAATIFYGISNVKKNPAIAFSVFWFYLTLFPVLNILPINAYMAEHWLYLPSIGFFACLAFYLAKFVSDKKLSFIAGAGIAVILIYLAFFTVKQNNYWNTPIYFYETTLKYAQNYRILSNLGQEYEHMGQIEKAVSTYEKALKLNPKDKKIFNNLGTLYANKGSKDNAIKYFNETLKLDPNDATANGNLANIYMAADPKKAISLYKKAIELNPYFVDAYNNLGVAYEKTGNVDEAIAAYKKAIQVDPDYPHSYNNLAIAYYRLKKFDLSIEYFDKAAKRGFVNETLKKYLSQYRK